MIKEREKEASLNYMTSFSQVSVFIIIAILIVVGIGVFFAFRGSLFQDQVPNELRPVYSYYQSCVNEETLNGAIILGQQAGYIKTPEFSPGNDYMPFSSHLGFLDMGVPYWYYLSASGKKVQQVPSLEKMESQLSDFLKERMILCDLSEFEEQGFEIIMGEIKEVSSEINEREINVQINQDLSIELGDNSWFGNVHNLKSKSSLGKFYNLASKIYNFNKENMFLENYGVDVLRLYAPVDGMEITCASKIWDAFQVRDDLMTALSANIPMTKIKGNYYDLSDKEHEYFVQDIGEKVDVNINFMYLNTWPTKMEVWPSENGVMKADPVGDEEGLEMLGFCYVPYHFVYDLGYPVLIQIYDGLELFQFPVVVYLEKNSPREAKNVEGLPDVVPELCEHKNTVMKVNTYNNKFESVEANIKFNCFATTCDIGKTSIQNNEAILVGLFPQCVNGYIVANAEGYETKKQIVLSTEENEFILILDKKYPLEVDLGGVNNALVSFSKDGSSISISYPEQKMIELSEGEYDVQVYVYSNSDINLQGSTYEKCSSVPREGILGGFGFEEKKCYDVVIPAQMVSRAVSGGGAQTRYVSEGELNGARKIIIKSDSFGIPKGLEDLQINYNLAKIANLDIRFG